MAPVAAALAHLVIFSPDAARAPKSGNAAAGPSTAGEAVSDLPGAHGAHGTERAARDDGGDGDGDGLSDGPAERDKDLEDDLREAAQILFYTSREAGVSRDRMLRQVGLAKGLAAFADLVTHDTTDGAFYSIRSQRARLLVVALEPGIFAYANIALAHDPAKPGEAQPGAQGLSDALLVDAIRRGYDGFCLLHSPLSRLLPPTPALSAAVDNYFTRFSHALDSAAAAPSLASWLGAPAPAPSLPAAATAAVDALAIAVPGAAVGVFRPAGPLVDPPPSDLEPGALARYLLGVLERAAPVVPVAPAPAPDKRKGERKPSWALSWGARGAASPSRASTPVESARERTDDDAAGERGKRKWLGMGTIGLGGLGGLGGASGGAGGTGGLGALGTLSGLGTGLGEAVSGVGAAVSGMGAALKLGSRSKANDTVAVADAPEPTGGDDAAGAMTDAGSTPVADSATHAEFASADGHPLGKADEAAAPAEAHPADQLGSASPALEDPTLHDDAPSTSAGSHGAPTAPLDAPAPAQAPADAASAPGTPLRVDPAGVDVAELALAETERVDMTWDSREVWLAHAGVWARRRVVWVIRDGMLLYIVYPPATGTDGAAVRDSRDPPDPSASDASATPTAPTAPDTPPTDRALAVFAALAPALPEPPREALANASLVIAAGRAARRGPEIDAAAERAMLELRTLMLDDPAVVEAHVRTPAQRFVGARRAGNDELFMLVGRTDASLPDAEHAMRAAARTYPQFA